MMIISFKHPDTKTANPLVDFNPGNKNHYPSGYGLYIYGLRARVDGALKFIPLAVGEGNLFNALYKRHYHGKFFKAYSNLKNNRQHDIKERKEIWNFSKEFYTGKELNNIYSDMRAYDGFNRNQKNNPAFFNQLCQLKHLLYFQNSEYFNSKYAWSTPVSNITSDQAILMLAEKSFDPAYTGIRTNLQVHYLDLYATLCNLVSHFYFVYSDDPMFANEPNRHAAEVATKSYLQSQGMYTTADSHKKGNKDLDIQFDFSKVQAQTINLNDY
jgi:hypothetical protein